jgi:hypothetical protein
VTSDVEFVTALRRGGSPSVALLWGTVGACSCLRWLTLDSIRPATGGRDHVCGARAIRAKGNDRRAWRDAHRDAKGGAADARSREWPSALRGSRLVFGAGCRTVRYLSMALGLAGLRRLRASLSGSASSQRQAATPAPRAKPGAQRASRRTQSARTTGLSVVRLSCRAPFLSLAALKTLPRIPAGRRASIRAFRIAGAVRPRARLGDGTSASSRPKPTSRSCSTDYNFTCRHGSLGHKPPDTRVRELTNVAGNYS